MSFSRTCRIVLKCPCMVKHSGWKRMIILSKVCLGWSYSTDYHTVVHRSVRVQMIHLVFRFSMADILNSYYHSTPAIRRWSHVAMVNALIYHCDIYTYIYTFIYTNTAYIFSFMETGNIVWALWRQWLRGIDETLYGNFLDINIVLSHPKFIIQAGYCISYYKDQWIYHKDCPFMTLWFDACR